MPKSQAYATRLANKAKSSAMTYIGMLILDCDGSEDWFNLSAARDVMNKHARRLGDLGGEHEEEATRIFRAVNAVEKRFSPKGFD